MAALNGGLYCLVCSWGPSPNPPFPGPPPKKNLHVLPKPDLATLTQIVPLAQEEPSCLLVGFRERSLSDRNMDSCKKKKKSKTYPNLCVLMKKNVFILEQNNATVCNNEIIFDINLELLESSLE